MAYTAMDDGFFDHPKNWGLSDGAIRLHGAAITYSHRHLTDGHVPKDRVSTLVPRFRSAVVKELLVNHWEDKGDCYVIRDYLQWNESKVQVEALRADRSAAGRKGAQNRWHTP